MARPAKYPWAEWADGNVHEIDLRSWFKNAEVPDTGEAYAVEKLKTAMRVYASRKGKRLMIERVMRRHDLPYPERPVVLVFQFLGKGQEPAEVFERIAAKDLVPAAMATCPTCGRGGPA